MAGKIFLLFGFAVGTIAPPALIFPLAINEAFNYFDQLTVFGLISISCAIGFLINTSSGKVKIKNVGIYVTFAIAILGFYMAKAASKGITNLPTTTLNNLATAFQTLASSVSTQNLGAFLVGSFTLIINIFAFILQLPLIISDLIFLSIQQISPNLYTAVSIFQPVLPAGLYLWIILVAYLFITKNIVVSEM
jgi:hypothetical protein